jgi:hypothetical protein
MKAAAAVMIGIAAAVLFYGILIVIFALQN